MLIGERKELKPIRIGFIGFHHLFNPVWNVFTLSLLHRFRLDVALQDPSGDLECIPDFLFFSVYEKRHLDSRYDSCVKIFTCEENIRPPWTECDYALTCDHWDTPRHLRLPIYVRFLFHLPHQISVKQHFVRYPNLTLVKDDSFDPVKVLSDKTKFCNFVFSNPGPQERIRFFDLLSKYKKVDAGGNVRNNLGRRVDDKLSFIEDYKFTIAFENSSYPGYVSEKIVEPMVTNSLPIYWGSPTIALDFHERSVVLANHRRLEDVVDEVVALDLDDSLYVAKMSEPWFANNVPNHYCSRDYLTDFMEKVFSERQRFPRDASAIPTS